MQPKMIDTIPLPVAMWHVTQPGYTLIKNFEKLRLQAYDDGFGNRAIGYGHSTEKDGLTSITGAQAEALLKLDCARALHCLRSNLTTSLFINEVNALVSLVYNIGCTAFITSHLRKAIEARDAEAVKREWLRWNRVDGKVVRGLTRRRTAELAMWCEVPF